MDLFLFYVKVQRAGGYEAAVANKLWKGIYMELGGHPSNTSAATCTRRHYEKSRFTLMLFLVLTGRYSTTAWCHLFLFLLRV